MVLTWSSSSSKLSSSSSSLGVDWPSTPPIERVCLRDARSGFLLDSPPERGVCYRWRSINATNHSSTEFLIDHQGWWLPWITSQFLFSKFQFQILVLVIILYSQNLSLLSSVCQLGCLVTLDLLASSAGLRSAEPTENRGNASVTQSSFCKCANLSSW